MVKPTIAKSGASLVMRETLANPEWTRLPKAGERLSGFSRSRLYELMTQGKIRSRTVGKLRFVNIPSLTALIEGDTPSRLLAQEAKPASIA